MSQKFWKKVSLITGGIVVFVAIAIMVSGAGLVPGYDFGAGAYYYADIPGFKDIIRDDSYHTSVPLWVHIVLFLAWGALMFFLWKKIDRRG